jgi:exodeoxyribonuclease III
MDTQKISFFSWNVNAYNQTIHACLLRYIGKYAPDVIFLCETKMKKDKLESYLNVIKEYNYIVNSHSPSSMHGVCMLIKKTHVYERLSIDLGIEARTDSLSKDASEGRLIAIKLNNLINVVGSYIPNSGMFSEYKLNYRTKIWDPAFFRLLESLRETASTIWMGDINVALEDIDVSHPETMSQKCGYTPQERENLKLFLSSKKWVDVWRTQHPNDKTYTWIKTKTLGKGMRLDNIIVTNDLLPKLGDSSILTNLSNLSDHCPINFDLQI